MIFTSQLDSKGLIEGEGDNDDGQWMGMVQTLKKFIHKKDKDH